MERGAVAWRAEPLRGIVGALDPGSAFRFAPLVRGRGRVVALGALTPSTTFPDEEKRSAAQWIGPGLDPGSGIQPQRAAKPLKRGRSRCAAALVRWTPDVRSASLPLSGEGVEGGSEGEPRAPGP